MGRKSEYKQTVEPHLDAIKEMAQNGLTQKQMAKALNVNKRTFEKYIQNEDALKDAINEGREVAVEALENAMYLSAIGGTVTVKKGMKVKHCRYENGKKISETETVEPYDEQMYVKPDTTAGIFLLKNWAKDRYAGDPQMLELKKKEQELKARLAEQELSDNEFDPFA